MGNPIVDSVNFQLKDRGAPPWGSVAAGEVTGAPIVTGVTGTFVQGNTLTISGSNISANRPGQLIYENFDSGTDGGLIDDIPSFTQNDGATPAHKYRYSSAESFSGSQSAKLAFTVGGAAGFRPEFNFPAPLNKVFVSMKIRIDTIQQSGILNIKHPRLISQAGLHGSTPNMGITYLGSTSCYQRDGDTGLQFYNQTPDKAGWKSLFYYIDLGTTDNYDGSRFIKAFGGDNWTASGLSGQDFSSVSNDGMNGSPAHPTSWEPSGNIKIKTSAADEQSISDLLLTFYKEAEDDYNVWVDQISVNDSLEAVFISPDSTWSAAKTNFDGLVLQPMSSRTSTSISVNCETGDLGVTRYLYVLNENGVANENGAVI